ncbi:YbaN family protein [Clostridium sp.]|uniref:YbaN family protein n=1 Tax=Clostridium sp. TaxID=1506 RepID=UPI002FCC09E4
MKNFKNVLLIGFGSVSLVAGVVGIFLPLLPTTPLLLLASTCYLRSSPKLSQKLLNNKYLGSYIKSYKENKGIPLKTKVLVLTLLWISLSYSIIFVISSLMIKFLLIIIGTLVTKHIITIKTLRNISS